jgi:hypothetical protein
MQCPICEARTELFGRATVLKGYHAEFCRCLSCGFLFAEDPVWLDEAYASAITSSDVGLVDRNLWFSKVAGSIVSILFNANGRFVDFGGGTGLFTRLMRDAGFDWYWFDPSCRNIFAEGYAANIRDGGRYELLTAAELFEHLVDPVQTMADLCKLSSNILFTTRLLPNPPPRLDEWWYYGLEHGQHVSFYTRRSLRMLGEKFGLQLTSNGENLHLFSRKGISKMTFKLATSFPVSLLVARLTSRQSLLPADFERARTGNMGNDANRS